MKYHILGSALSRRGRAGLAGKIRFQPPLVWGGRQWHDASNLNGKLMRLIVPFTAGMAVSLLVAATGARAAVDKIPAAVLPPIIRSWETQAGLPQNTVNAIVQDRSGYLWLGTHDGLARFDGMRFKIFGFEAGLPSLDIASLLVDRKGSLWIGTYGSGLCQMQDGRIKIMPSPDGQPGSDTITCLQEDAQGRLWAGTGGGLHLYQDGKLIKDSALMPLQHAPVRCLLRSRDGTTMWIGSLTEGLMTYQNGRLETCPGPAEHESIIAQSLFEDRENRLWVSIGNGMVLRRDNDQWRIFNETNGLPFAYVTSLAEDADGTIWAGSLDDGLYRFDGSRFSVLRQKDGLSADDIRSLYCDQEGDLWVGTRTGGLDRLNRRRLAVIGSAQGLTNDFTRSVAQTPDGTIWVGTTGGSLYRGNLSHFEPFRPDPIVYFYASVESVLTAPDGSLWWGSGALMHWQDNRLVTCITNEPWLRNVQVTALQNDRRGGMWIGTGRGRLLHLQNGAFTEFPNEITHATITSLAVQPDGSLWVGTVANGVKFIRAGSEVVSSITNGLPPKASIRTLYLDGDGTLWIGTAGNGLNCWRAGKVTSFTGGQGLAPRTVSQIVEDDYGCLWLGCGRSIYKVGKRDLLDCADGKRPFVHSHSFGINDGMLAEECSGGFCPAGLKTKSGLICISTVKGLVFLDPNTLHDETPPPETLLEEVLVNGQRQTLATAGENAAGGRPRLLITPGAKDLEIRYTAIEFSSPEKIGFRYKLDPMDTAWTEAGSGRAFNYQRIPPGDYTFHVQACNADGVWNEHETTLKFTVLPFFWETAWFHATSTLTSATLLAGVLWLVVRRRYKRRLARLQTLNAIERERRRISKDMHDQVGGVLTQVSQLSDMGLNEADDRELVKNRFNRIGDRARAAVQSLDEIVWATNPKNDNLASFTEYISRFSDEFFEYTNVRCWQEMPAAPPALPLRADVRHNVFLAVREALNNALKHSRCTEVWLKMKFDAEQHEVNLEVTDNGSGFAPGETAAGGNGLGNLQSRLAECDGKTFLSSAPGKGTRVRFVFPVKP